MFALRTFQFVLVCATVVTSLGAGCTKKDSGFTGKSQKLAIKKIQGNEQGVLATQFNVEVNDVFTSLSKRDIWFVSKNGTVERFSASNSTNSEGVSVEDWKANGKWTLAGGESGHRTYVTEVGLIIGKTGTGCIYRVGDESVSTGALAPVWCASGQSAEARMCVTSYRVGGKVYVGGAYNKDNGQLAFVKIPVDKSKTNSLDVAAAQEQIVGNGKWGYSCFTDQSRGLFWSAWYEGSIYGVNLNTGAALSGSTHAPNSNFVAAKLPSFNVGTGNAKSYAISGDVFGNILNGDGIYTYAYEPLSKTVFGSSRDHSKLSVTRVECFASKSGCVANQDHWSWDLASFGAAVGPLSSLNDGRVVAVGNNQVFLFSLKDYKNPGAGVTVKKIANASGQGYMYTDFTGATLYAADVEKTVDFSAEKLWIQNKNVAVLKMRWIAESGQPEAWRGLTMEVRCYAKGSKKPEFGAVNTMPVAGSDIAVEVGGCKSGQFDSLDFRVKGDGSSGGFSKTRGLAFQVGQVK